MVGAGAPAGERSWEELMRRKDGKLTQEYCIVTKALSTVAYMTACAAGRMSNWPVQPNAPYADPDPCTFLTKRSAEFCHEMETRYNMLEEGRSEPSDGHRTLLLEASSME
ncbi:hypothetical protein M8818_006524 [Zalaria obscura]|uniref:Uncharacterized protein n=1 Tax=Zalaria obscura TaxID=2024903 RepID=A0ACC3S728_9PEZI